MRKGHAPEEAVADRGYYDSSDYFRRGGKHLLDPESRFHRYRASQVRRLCGSLEGQRVVDLGCGWGTISFDLSREAKLVVGVDFAGPALRICRERLLKAPRRNLHFVRADARLTGLEGGCWDLVVAADLVEHLPPTDTLEVYREARRLLRAGGALVIWTPNPHHFLERLRAWRLLRPDPSHVDYKTMDRLARELKEEGFAVEVARFAESHLPVVSTLERWTLAWAPWMRRRIAVRGRKGGGT